MESKLSFGVVLSRAESLVGLSSKTNQPQPGALFLPAKGARNAPMIRHWSLVSVWGQGLHCQRKLKRMTINWTLEQAVQRKQHLHASQAGTESASTVSLHGGGTSHTVIGPWAAKVLGPAMGNPPPHTHTHEAAVKKPSTKNSPRKLNAWRKLY